MKLSLFEILKLAKTLFIWTCAKLCMNIKVTVKSISNVVLVHAMKANGRNRNIVLHTPVPITRSLNGMHS
jgi:hypothetical protein